MAVVKELDVSTQTRVIIITDSSSLTTDIHQTQASVVQESATVSIPRHSGIFKVVNCVNMHDVCYDEQLKLLLMLFVHVCACMHACF